MYIHSIPLCALAQNNKYMLNNNAYTHTCNHTLSKQNIKSLLTVKLNSEARYKKQLKSGYPATNLQYSQLMNITVHETCQRQPLDTTPHRAQFAKLISDIQNNDFMSTNRIRRSKLVQYTSQLENRPVLWMEKQSGAVNGVDKGGEEKSVEEFPWRRSTLH